MNTDIPVLIVDDYSTMRRTIGDVMRRFGFTNLAYAEDGQMAWEMMQENSYELLLLDWSMPRMTGLELLKLIRCPGGRFTDVAVLAITGEAEQELYQQDLSGPIVLVMGAEGNGMRRLTRDLCDFLVRLTMAGSVSSLNVSVATGVCLFEIVRQRRPL